jgi:hypothetical protein
MCTMSARSASKVAASMSGLISSLTKRSRWFSLRPSLPHLKVFQSELLPETGRKQQIKMGAHTAHGTAVGAEQKNDRWRD